MNVVQQRFKSLKCKMHQKRATFQGIEKNVQLIRVFIWQHKFVRIFNVRLFSIGAAINIAILT